MLISIALRVLYILVCMIFKHVKNLRKIEKFYLRVIIFTIMHDYMSYIVRGLSSVGIHERYILDENEYNAAK
jgi:hypothetical protein